jgi:hypothetical protein
MAIIEKFYVDLNDNYLGSFQGFIPPDAVQVNIPPAHAKQKWDKVNKVWLPLTSAQVREGLPALTSRQFWLAAASIGIMKEDCINLVKAIVATTPEEIEDKIILLVEVTESTSFERANPNIDKLSSLLSIPTEQLDSLWVWAATIQ